jgi:hypothetical protein
MDILQARKQYIYIYKMSKFKLEKTLRGDHQVNSVNFSPDGMRVVSGSGKFMGGDGVVTIWNAVTGKVENTLLGHSGWVRSVAFSVDGSRIVSGSWDKTIKIWHNAAMRMAHMALRQKLPEPGLTASIASYLGATKFDQDLYYQSISRLNTERARERARRRMKNLNKFNSLYPEGATTKTRKRRSLSKSKSRPRSKSKKHKSI